MLYFLFSMLITFLLVLISFLIRNTRFSSKYDYDRSYKPGVDADILDSKIEEHANKTFGEEKFL